MSTTQENTEARSICPKCGGEIKAGAKFCPTCGNPVSGLDVQPATAPQTASAPATQENTETRNICPKCGGEIKAGAKFCPICGNPVSGQAVRPAAAQQTASIKPKVKKPLGGKGKLVIIAVVLIGIFIIVSRMNNPANLVKNSSLDDFGSQTIGEMVDDNFKNVKWSYEKLDNDSGFVYAKGYCVTFQENMSLKFYFDKETSEFRLIAIDWLDSGESDTNLFSIAITLGVLYG